MFVNKLANRIKKLREEKKLTQKELANIINISNTTLSQYESGQRMPNDIIKIKLADFFNVSLDYLVGRTNNIHESITPEGNLSNRNTKYKLYSEFFDVITQTLYEKGIIEDRNNISTEIMNDILKYGLDAAGAIIKARQQSKK